MLGFSASPAGSAPPDALPAPAQHGPWRQRVSVAGVLLVGASMAVVGVTSTAAQANTVNIARNGTATGSAYGACNSSETPAKAIDGSVAGTSNKWCSTATTKYLEVDLGSLQFIHQFVVKHAGAGGESATLNTKTFNISVRATTGDSWTQVATVTGSTASTTTHDVASVSARYAKLDVIDGEQAGSNGPARIYEFEVYNGANVALSQTATGSTSCNGNQTPAKAVDGSVATTNNKWCSTAATKYLEVDLGSAKDIRQFVVKHAGAGGESTAYNTKDFTISVRSSTSDSWTQKVSVTSNTASTTTHDVSSTFARYLRLDVTDGTQASQDHAARVYELEAYGYANLAIGASTTLMGGLACNGTDVKARMVDGNLTTKWCQASHWSIAMGIWYRDDLPAIQIDLGATKTITAIRMYHAGSAGESSTLNTKEFRISNATQTTTYYNSGTINENVTTATINATDRYLTVTFTEPEQNIVIFDNSARIYEFEVFGY